MILPTEGEMLG